MELIEQKNIMIGMVANFYEKAKYFTKKYASPNNSYKDYDAIQDWDFNI